MLLPLTKLEKIIESNVKTCLRFTIDKGETIKFIFEGDDLLEYQFEISVRDGKVLETYWTKPDLVEKLYRCSIVRKPDNMTHTFEVNKNHWDVVENFHNKLENEALIKRNKAKQLFLDRL